VHCGSLLPIDEFREPGDEAAVSALLASNRDLLAKMTTIGGKRYAPYSMVISSEEWQAHYGPEVWRRFVAAKAKYDPNRVLSPHPAIFEERLAPEFLFGTTGSSSGTM